MTSIKLQPWQCANISITVRDLPISPYTSCRYDVKCVPGPGQMLRSERLQVDVCPTGSVRIPERHKAGNGDGDQDLSGFLNDFLKRQSETKSRCLLCQPASQMVQVRLLWAVCRWITLRRLHLIPKRETGLCFCLFFQVPASAGKWSYASHAENHLAPISDFIYCT